MNNTELVCKLREENPDLNGAEIGRQVGVSRERARQILSEAGLPTARTGKRCQCGKIIERDSLHCWVCFNRHRRKVAYMILPCACGCGQLFERRRSILLRQIRNGQKTFCMSHAHAIALQGKSLRAKINIPDRPGRA